MIASKKTKKKKVAPKADYEVRYQKPNYEDLSESQRALVDGFKAVFVAHCWDKNTEMERDHYLQDCLNAVLFWYVSIATMREKFKGKLMSFGGGL